MTFKAYLFTYVLGGLTFVPLLLVAVLLPAWLLLKKDEGGTSEDGGNKETRAGYDKKTRRKSLSDDENLQLPEAAAEATFAVLRSYDFPAANAALSGRNSSGNTAGGVTGSTDVEGEDNDAAKSSMYQSVYRSVFAPARSSTTGVSNSKEVLEDDEADSNTDNRNRRKTTPANVFFIVLRHGHLMLYDSAAQMDVRHVISLAHHTVSLSEGLSESGEEEKLRDGDLFIKRTAIVLTPTDLPNGHLQSRSSPPKPFYLFSTLCSEKEDFYHALLYTRTSPPIPEPIEPNDAIKLQSGLHSTSLTPETRAFNALIGRVFLGIYHTPWLENLIQKKVEKKISRVQKPSFLASLTVRSIDLGDSAPMLSNPRLKDLNISGDTTIAYDVRYSGGIKLTISALAKIDLGPRFKVRTVDLVLATSLQRLQGHMLVRIKPPPSNRIWFCFESPPDMDVKVEPVVSQRKISYTFILRAIEDRIRAVVTETLVKPNWDDVPFFNTVDQNVRGGIWRSEGNVDGQDQKHELLQKNAKTKSMPILPLGADHDSSAGSSGSETVPKAATGASTPIRDATTELKRRSVASLPNRSATTLSTSSPEPSKPVRSPSFTSPSASQPSVALDEASANIDPNRTEEAQNQQRRWRIRAAAPPLPARKEAVEAMREMRDRVLAHRENAEAEATQADILEGVGTYVEEPSEETNSSDAQTENAESRRSSDTPNTSLRSTMRSNTSASTSTNASAGQQKKTILAATAAATTAARNWSWNALANARTKGGPADHRRSSSGNASSPQQQPMGRGQPLPPPGQPLPGPQKGLFGGLGSVRRKPLPKQMPQPPTARNDTSSRGSEKSATMSVEEVQDAEDAQTATSDEFGPWRQNSGTEFQVADARETDDDPSNSMTPHASRDDSVANHAAGQNTDRTSERKVPPPLPARRGTEAPTASAADPPEDTTTSETAKATSSQDDEDASANAHAVSSEVDSAERVLQSDDVPNAQNEVQAEAKFALGANVHEDDFEHDETSASRTTETNDVTAINEDLDSSRPISQISEGSELVAIPAPVDSEDESSEEEPTSTDAKDVFSGDQMVDEVDLQQSPLRTSTV